MNTVTTHDPSAAHDAIEKELRAQLAAVTGGLAPEPFARAWWDWFIGVSQSSQALESLSKHAWTGAMDTWQYAAQAVGGAAQSPATDDRRFADAAWNQWPFNVYARSYKNWESWWTGALASVPNLDKHSAERASFVGRQMLDAVSPTNYLHTNPELIEQTRVECGQNLLRGYQHWIEDLQRTLQGLTAAGTDEFVVGRDIAVTPGKVVLRNDLIELIQYSPQTADVHAEPILIIPPWIMKYYILDLSPTNSLVKFLVSQGHTVFMASWKNPTAVDRNLGMADYFNLGFMAALDAVTAIIPEQKVHVTGYCIGGTLSFIGAAALAQRNDSRIGSLSLLASLCDFSEPGELSLFINPAQLATLDAAMSKQGYLDGRQMVGAFQMLRSNELLWQPIVNNYIRGRRARLNDLMTWNTDATRMPWRMHSEYLRQLYLENQLANGSFELEDQQLKLSDIQVPMFVVGTEADHVTPWRAVFKARQHTHSSDYTFLLTSGGHNAGIVSGPQNPKRRHRLLKLQDASSALLPDEWLAQTPAAAGSWWPVWQQWLQQHSSAPRTTPPTLGNSTQGYWPTTDAPGEYVLQK
jgi:polyhydroxyalkanoate synthase